MGDVTNVFFLFDRSHPITSSSLSRACSTRKYAPIDMGFWPAEP